MKNAIDLVSDFQSGIDISSTEKKIIKEICEKTGFVVEKNLWRSSYWGSKQIGASHWSGIYKNKPSVLKIQGAKPNISEVDFINEFSKQNRSKLIRPPIIYADIAWDELNGYGAIISEHVQGQKVVEDGKIITEDNISRFMAFYKEYRNNCIPAKPWIEKPDKNVDFETVLNNLIATSMKAYPNTKFRQIGDLELAKKAYKLLSKVYKDVDLEFMHGHFSCKDLIYQDDLKEKVVLFSNLFWKWKYPYSDAVFAYHWFMYELAHVDKITPEIVEKQREIWLNEIFKVVGHKGTKLLNAALLERSVAGFVVDSFLCDPKKEISRYLYESSKNEAERLISELE